MFHDFTACATDDSPYIIIYNHAQPAFRTLADQQSDRDYDATNTNQNARNAQILSQDQDNNNSEADAIDQLSPAIYNDRNHRVDMISFFARDTFKRQTGNPGTYVPNQTTGEAMIWYGHTYIPNNTGGYSTGDTAPGSGTFGGNDNPNNFFATQWIVGRQAIMLAGNPGVAPTDANGTPQNYFRTNTLVPDLSPLVIGNDMFAASGSSNDSGTLSALQYSRCDVADTSMLLFKNRLQDVITATPAVTWFNSMMGGVTPVGSNSVPNRFACNPFVSKPISSAEFARTSPIFLTGCSQFMVEFAGDYLVQPTIESDVATAVGQDGTIDFYRDGNGKRQVRWYGLPRNTDLRDTTGNNSETIASGPVITATTGDVVPVRDVILANALTPPSNVTLPDSWFERTFPTVRSNYAASGAMASNAEYLCAWGPNQTNRPSLIRITYSLDDPNSRLGNPLTYEYVFKIK